MPLYLRKKEIPNKIDNLISMLLVWQRASEWSILFWTPALPTQYTLLAEQIKGMYLTCVLASENTKPYFLMRHSSYPTFFFNLSSFSQTPLPEWEWKVRVNQGVIAHHASQCYKCCLWFRVPDPKKTLSPWLCSQRAQISILGSRSFCRSMRQLCVEF